MSANFKIAAAKVAAPGHVVSIETNGDVIASLANSLALTMWTRNSVTLGDVITLDELKECFGYSLRIVVRQGAVLKQGHEVVPKFLTDVTIAIRTKYRGRLLTPVLEEEPPKRPDSYANFLNVCESLMIPTGRVARLLPDAQSGVLAYGLRSYDGETCVVGYLNEPNIEEMLVRTMITVPSQEQDKLDRILGHLDYLYASQDELCRQWATSVVPNIG